jgi:glycosyltransferase involved in cell wall biosynthesis
LASTEHRQGLERADPVRPFFSVIITTYNRASIVREAIDAVLAQTFTDFELIVCDDGSTDDSARILSDSYGRLLKVVHADHVGPAGARNAALRAASGQYIACLDSDDLWTTWTLECVHGVIGNVGERCAVYLRPVYLDLDKDVSSTLRSSVSYRRFDSYFDTPDRMICGAGMIGAIPRDCIRDVGGFSEDMLNAEDRDLALRMADRLGFVVIDSPPTLLCREHADQATKDIGQSIRGWTTIAKRCLAGRYGGGRSDARMASKVLPSLMAWSLDVLILDGRWSSGLRLYYYACQCAFVSGLWRKVWTPGGRHDGRAIRDRVVARTWRFVLWTYPLFLALVMASRLGHKLADRYCDWFQRSLQRAT